ncbi:MAG: serine--tRNA ligase [Mycoplasmatales bacterium]|nr:serine--tRNA ligase [Mycoplasmatales bacterium]
MLDLKNIISDTENVKNELKKRNFDTKKIDEIVNISKNRSKLMSELQNFEAERNSLSKLIGQYKAQGKNFEEVIKKVEKIKKSIYEIKEKEKDVNNEIRNLLLYVPNLPSFDVPVGKDENDNVLIKEHGDIGRSKVTNVKPHHQIAVELDIVDFERAVKLSGSRFWSYKKQGAKLVRALENFMLDTHIQNGYIEWRPPVIVKSNILEGTGQLPKFKEDLFKIEGMDSYLIPTAEVPITNLHNGEIIDLKNPIAYTAFTLCFRAEAGSGGKDMKGLIRAHQFNKVELVKFVSEKDLNSEFSKTLNDAKNILEKLKIPYQELMLCTGDLGFSAEKTVDLEIWMPSENRYRETSSVSSFGDFQGRRSSIRYKDENGKNRPVYTINGSALAIDRVVASILEIYQNPDGTITVPEVLIPYMQTDIIKK